jgi:hypothetical protein
VSAPSYPLVLGVDFKFDAALVISLSKGLVIVYFLCSLNTHLQLRNLCITRFKLARLTCTMHVIRVGSKLSFF